MSDSEMNQLVRTVTASVLNGLQQPDAAAPPAVATAKGKAKPQAADATLAWIYRAIEYYRAADGNKSKGIHTVISGFNGAFKMKFGKDPIATTQAYVQQGKLQGHPARKGYMLYKAGEMPTQRAPKDHSADLAAIG